MSETDHLYTRVLVYAYRQGSKGFSWKQLGRDLKLTDTQTVWVEDTLFNRMLTTESLFDRITEFKDKEQRFCLSGRGIRQAIDYLQLVEAERTGKRAEKIAIASIIIGAAVGLAQVIATFGN